MTDSALSRLLRIEANCRRHAGAGYGLLWKGLIVCDKHLIFRNSIWKYWVMYCPRRGASNLIYAPSWDFVQWVIDRGTPCPHDEIMGDG